MNPVVLNPVVPEKTLNRMARLAVTGHLDSAQQILIQLALPSSLNEKVQNILTNPNGNSSQDRHQDIKNRVIEVLNEPIPSSPVARPTTAKKISSFNSCPRLNKVKKEQLIFKNANVCQGRPSKAGFLSDVHMPKDIAQTIFLASMACGTFKALRCLNRAWNECQVPFQVMFQQQLKNGTLTVIDAKTMEFEIDDEPLIDQVEVAYHCSRLAQHVFNGEGLTLVTIPKGISVENYVNKTRDRKEMAYPGMSLIQSLTGDEDVFTTSEICSYRALITNNIFSQTLGLFELEEVKFYVEELGCEMPQVQEHVFQLNSLKSIFNKSVCADYFAFCSNGKLTRANSVMAIIGSKEENYALTFQGRNWSSLDGQTGSAGVIRSKKNNNIYK